MKVFARQESPHYQNVRWFMELAKQCPEGGFAAPLLLDEKTRKLRAKLIFEEAMEVINGLGVRITIGEENSSQIVLNEPGHRFVAPHDYEVTGEYDLVETVDGCADIIVVTTGTLIATGVTDIGLQNAVDENNLAKFGPGHSFRDDGKLIKPPRHKPPDLVQVLVDQGADPGLFGIEVIEG